MDSYNISLSLFINFEFKEKKKLEVINYKK